MRVKGLKQLHMLKKRGVTCVIAPLALGLVLALFLVGSATGIGVDMRISTDSSGNQGNYDSFFSSLSADGRYVAFSSQSTNLVAGDTNYYTDIFVKDTISGATTRVSTDSAGNEANNYNDGPSMSADGRYVAFTSGASNLVPGDTNSYDDVFVKDRWTGAISRVSTDSAGNQSNQSSFGVAISANGRYVAFTSNASNLVAGDTNAGQDIFVKDRYTGATTRVSTSAGGGQSNDASSIPSISNDGRYVTFRSFATNLVPGDTNGSWDVFFKDTTTGAITRLSTDSLGNEGNYWSDFAAVSANGRYVSFLTAASNLVPGDTNGYWDVVRAPTNIACTVNQPALTLGMTNTYWATYADYLAQLLSIDYSVANTGVNMAYTTQIVGATANNGVYCFTCTPPVTYSLGNFVPSASWPFTLKYFIPIGVGSFTATVSATAQDGCGNGYTYP